MIDPTNPHPPAAAPPAGSTDGSALAAAADPAARFGALRSEIDAQHAAAADRQAARGKRGARERVLALLDPGTFTELDPWVRHRATDLGMDRARPWGDGVVTGWGEIDSRPVVVFSQDFTVFGGSLGEAFAAKIVKVMDLAERMGIPVVGINDSAGARIQEGVEGLAGYGEVFYRNVRLSGVVPQVSVIAGPCAGGAVYSPAMTDVVLMVEAVGQMFITGPDVIKSVTGEDVGMEELGGAAVHHGTSGVAHLVAPDEDAGNELVRAVLSYLPANNLEDPPWRAPGDDPEREAPELDDLVPVKPNRPYDIHDVLRAVLDDGEFLELQSAFAPNIVCGFGRLDGFPVGVVANQPMHLAGTLDIGASEKAARFVRTCDAFNVPLLVFVDVPGFLPGLAQEHEGIIRRGSKLLYAFAEATVPRFTVITRKAYGGAYVVMNSKHVGADLNLAWPTAEIAVMGSDTAVGLVFRRELAEAADPAARRAELVADYRERFAAPWQAAGRGYIDDVIAPRETRRRLIRALRLARSKRSAPPPRKHGNIPL